MSALNLKVKFSIISLVNIAAVAALAFFAYWGIQQTLQLSKLDTVTKVIQRHMEGDMMHDAMRGDVLTVVNAAKAGNLKDIKQSEADVHEHADNFLANMTSAQEEDLPENLRQEFKDVMVKVEDYKSKALEVVEAAKRDYKNETTSETAALLPAFKESFEVLEEGMESVGGSVEKWSGEIKNRGFDTAEESSQKIILFSALALLISLAVPVLSILTVFVPQGRLAKIIDRVSNEDISMEIPYQKRRDEIGIMAKSLAVLKEKVTEAFKLKQMVEEMPINIMTADPKNNFVIDYANQTTLATLKNLEKYLPVSADKVIGSSFDIFHKNPTHQRQMLSDPKNLPHRAKINLGNEVLELKVSAIYDKNHNYVGPMVAWSVITAAEKLADNFESNIGGVVKTVSTASDKLQHSATALKSSIEQLSASAREISHRVSESTQIVENASSEGEKTNEIMLDLNNAAGKVSEIISLISNIASQTNLLALNATIEAARAGEAGKGFTVVANEVKELANQTSGAITEISKQISDMQGKTKTAFSAIDSITNIIKQVNEVATTIAGAVEEQQAAIQEIARNIVSGSEMGDGIMGKTSETSSVYGLSIQLGEQSKKLEAHVEEFVNKVRTA